VRNLLNSYQKRKNQQQIKLARKNKKNLFKIWAEKSLPIGKLESKEFREIKTDKASKIKRKFANQVGKENILVRKTKSWLL